MKTKRDSQHQITFQNQSHLIERHFENRGIKPKLMDICLATDLMVRFCQEGYSKELSDLFDRFESHIQSQQLKSILPEVDKNKIDKYNK
jgi:hypothetical protein